MEDLILIIIFIFGVFMIFWGAYKGHLKDYNFTQYCYKQNMIPAKTEAGYFCVDQRNLVK